MLEWVAISSSRDHPNPGIQPASLMFPALAGGFFTTAPPGKPVGNRLGVVMEVGRRALLWGLNSYPKIFKFTVKFLLSWIFFPYSRADLNVAVH